MMMLPEHIIPAVNRMGTIVPSFFDAADHPWLNALLDDFERFCGRPERELHAHLSLPLGHDAPPFKTRAAISLLRKLYSTRVDSPVKPSVARESLFLAAASTSETSFDRSAVVESVASRHGITVDELERAIVADLPGERIVRRPQHSVSAASVVQSMNDLIVRSLVGRAREVTIRAEGAMRAVVRQAKLRGLLCSLRPADERGVSLVISGPFSLFRHTLLYGRALGSLVTRLPYCARYELTATCQLRGQFGIFTLSSSDDALPAIPGIEPRRFDSKVEAAFAKEFHKLTPDWDLIREPEPVQVGSTFIFPGFAVVNRLDPRRRCLVEIVGYWTTDYLARKLEAIRASGRDDIVLCIDEALACSDGAPVPSPRVIRFRRRIPADAVLSAVMATVSANERGE